MGPLAALAQAGRCVPVTPQRGHPAAHLAPAPEKPGALPARARPPRSASREGVRAPRVSPGPLAPQPQRPPPTRDPPGPRDLAVFADPPPCRTVRRPSLHVGFGLGPSFATVEGQSAPGPYGSVFAPWAGAGPAFVPAATRRARRGPAGVASGLTPAFSAECASFGAAGGQEGLSGARGCSR